MSISTLALSAALNTRPVSNEVVARVILCPLTHCRKTVVIAQAATIPVIEKDAKKNQKTVTWTSTKPNVKHKGLVNTDGKTTTGVYTSLKAK